MEKKIVKNFIYTGFGFPVTLKRVTMFKLGDTWAPRLNHEKVAKSVMRTLSKKASFTGNEIFFIRSFLKLSKVDFGKKLHVTHAAVSNWEKKRELIVPLQKGNKLAIDVLIKRPSRKKTNSKVQMRDLGALKIHPKLALAEIIGSKPVAKTEMLKRVWAYIKKNDMISKKAKPASPVKKKATRKTPLIRHNKTN